MKKGRRQENPIFVGNPAQYAFEHPEDVKLEFFIAVSGRPKEESSGKEKIQFEN